MDQQQQDTHLTVDEQKQNTNIPRSAREQTKKLKKIIIITFCAMLVFVLVYFIFSAFLYDAISQALIGYFPWLEDVLDDGVGNEYQGNNFSNIFYPIDYEYDIMKDQEYLGLDRNVYYYASSDQYGSVLVLDEENCGKQARGVTLLYGMVESIIEGDVESYNACFSDYYYEHKGIEPDPGFTMTQLYDIKITNMGHKRVSDDLGEYTQYEFVLQYSIHKNNGTFRSDIGSDKNAANYIVITDRNNGELLIENTLFPYHFSH